MMDIDKMEAGREMDELIARKLMGYGDDAILGNAWLYDHRYSTDIAATEIVLHKLENDGWEWELRRESGKYTFVLWRLEWATENLYQSRPAIGGNQEDTISLAICHTVLMAKENEQ